MLRLHDVQAVAVVLKDIKATISTLKMLTHRDAILLERYTDVCLAHRVIKLVVVVLAALIVVSQVSIIVLRYTVERDGAYLLIRVEDRRFGGRLVFVLQ